MVRFASLASLAVLAGAPALALAASGASIPKEPGVYWEQSMEMQMTGFAMPPTTSKICLPKKGALEQPPPAGDDQKCKLTDLKRNGSRMTWKMKCEDGVSGEGDITSSPDSYSGTMLMRVQGRDMRMKMSGKKVGGDCDANEMKRMAAEAQQEMETAQADQAKAHDAQCAEAAESMDFDLFVPAAPGMPVQCKDPAKLCAKLETRAGLVRYRDAMRDRDLSSGIQKLCKIDVAAIEKKLCAQAAKENDKKLRLAEGDASFILESCPDLAKALAKRECGGRDFTSMPEGPRELCIGWSRRALQQPRDEDAAVPATASGRYLKSGLPDVDEPPQKATKKKAKKPADEDEDESSKPKEPEDVKSRIMKGIFGR